MLAATAWSGCAANVMARARASSSLDLCETDLAYIGNSRKSRPVLAPDVTQERRSVEQFRRGYAKQAKRVPRMQARTHNPRTARKPSYEEFRPRANHDRRIVADKHNIDSRCAKARSSVGAAPRSNV
jgi:hypothetical protein